MANRTGFDNGAENGAWPGLSRMRLGRVRWTICAMLFVATSINYMDRQVIAILKPTLQHSIGLTELGYGYIVDAFQVAYALGLLAAGRTACASVGCPDFDASVLTLTMVARLWVSL